MTKRMWGIALFVLLATCAAATYAQNATTSLRGVVKDPSGAVVPGATITLLNNATGQSLTTTSKGGGEYQLQQIPPAKYDISVEAKGFGAQTKSAELLVNQPATIDFTLSLQSNNVVVNVSAEAQTLNTTDASLGNSVNNATIQSLPSETRNVPDLLSLEPGVFFLPVPSDPKLQDSRSGAVNGGRSDQGNITLDGVDDNDQVNGFAFTGVLRETQDSIEEFRVTTGNANADAGRSSGAQISLVTKSGTNKFHGAAYEYNRPTITVSNDWFVKQAELNSGLPNIPGKLIRNIFGGDVGGPILKDKLFFFANYEGSRLAESATVQETDPTSTYLQGTILYTGDNKNGTTETDSISASQVTKLDAGCTVCRTPAYAPGPGPDPNALAFFALEPPANGTAAGDGLNEGSYTFSSPNPKTLNTTIVRLDYIPSEKHRIFARGNLQKDTTSGTEQYPGQGPSSVLIDNTKGMTFGDTWSISPNMVNDIRYGYIRQGSGNSGVGKGDYIDFRYLSTPTAETRDTILSVPVNNIVDNFNWTKGKHSIEIGGNWRLIHQNRASNAGSFNSANSNPQWLNLGQQAPDPTTLGLNPVDTSFTESLNEAYANLVGDIPYLTDVYNYKVASASTASLLGDGAFISRSFKANEYEYFIQDSWHPLNNLTLTFGLRHTILQTPYETKGQQITPTIDTHAWYMEREAAAQRGQIDEPDLYFAPSGPVYNKPGYWPKSKNNIAPRFAIAYAPNPKTSIRAGFGIYYDHYGEGLVNVFDQNGSFGLTTDISNPASEFNYENSPRFTSRTTFPSNLSTGAAPPPTTATFPYQYPDGTFAISWGIDNRLKTPYSESIDFSVQRELPKGFTLETAYVGRLGRHLLQSLDLAEPVDYVDPQGAGDYYTAATLISKEVDQNGDNANAQIAPIPYFEHVFSFLGQAAATGSPTGGPESITQFIYTNEYAPNRAGLGGTEDIADIDAFCAYNQAPQGGCPAGFQSEFWQNQFATLYALSTIGMSYYNAGQVTLRHPMSHGLQADISYTYSRSIDMGSDAERSTFVSTGVAGSESEIQNTWRPYLNRGVSDFDTTHLITVDSVYQLPFGRGQAFLGGSSRLANVFIGGWQLSGIFRATSGLPFSLYEPGYTTNWTFSAYAVTTAKVPTHKYFDKSNGGNPQYFKNPEAINSGIFTGSPVRLPYPGEAGERNNFRGDGYLDLDNGLTKSWSLGELGNLKFAWEVYNVTNTVKFDPEYINSGLTLGELGVATAELSQPRRMQFSLRYDF